MDIMRGFGIPVPKGGMATSVEEAKQVYKTVIGDGKDFVIKAMVLTGKWMISSAWKPVDI
jgi:succinyl-CoA synthetase beta subunit